MEGNCRSETPPPSADICSSNELNRSNSDVSTLTAENFEDVLHYSDNVKPDDSTTWTDEKHSLYLELLEASFVKKLQHSMGLLEQCSEQDKGDKNISHIWPINVHNGSEQLAVVHYGCTQKINYKKGDPLSSVSDDARNHREIPWVCRSKCSGIHCPLASADMPESLKRFGTENDGEEGSGQNFVDEDILATSNMSRVKRFKTASADTSSRNQIMPKTYHRAIDSSTLGGDLPHNECASKTFESSVYPPT